MRKINKRLFGTTFAQAYSLHTTNNIIIIHFGLLVKDCVSTPPRPSLYNDSAEPLYIYFDEMCQVKPIAEESHSHFTTHTPPHTPEPKCV